MTTTPIMVHLFKRVSILLLLHCVVAQAGTIKDGFPCKKHDECVSGLHCVGKAGNERCKRPMIVGEYCGDPTWVCAKDLECRKVDGDEICVKLLKEGAYYCDAKEHACEAGLKCVGKTGAKRCKKPMGYGEYCGDPTWVCGDGLTCEGVNKEAVCVKTFPEGDPCGKKFDRCEKGTTCENKKCVKPGSDPSPKPSEEPKEYPSPKPSEEPEEEPKETPKPTKPKKPKRCTPSNSNCETGYYCVGRKGHEVCKKPMKEGESCRDPTWVCEKGLHCVGKGKKAFCRKPAPKEKNNSKGCGKSKKPCPTGQFCVGRKGREVCKRRMKEGESCKDPTWVCADGLNCIGKGVKAICSKKSGLGQACGRKSKCPSGLRCHPNRKGERRCSKVLKAGDKCGVEKYTFCVWGYRCYGKPGKKSCTKVVKRRKQASKKKSNKKKKDCNC